MQKTALNWLIEKVEKPEREPWKELKEIAMMIQETEQINLCEKFLSYLEEKQAISINGYISVKMIKDFVNQLNQEL